MKNLRIKKYVCGTFLASALLMVGCQTDEAVDEWGEPGQLPGDAGDVTLLLSVAGELATRTILPGSENVQHVTYVQLYIFDGTDENALCVASENIGWSAYFGNKRPTVSAPM